MFSDVLEIIQDVEQNARSFFLINKLNYYLSKTCKFPFNFCLPCSSSAH